MSQADYITLLLFVLGTFVISTLSAKRTSSQKDMFAAGGNSPWWVSGLSGFMTMFSAGTFVVWGGIAYELGFVAVMINTCYGIAALLVGYYVAGKWNTLGVNTPAEYVQLRFGTAGLHFFTWTMLLKRILGVSVSLYALAILLIALVPVNLNVAILVFGGIVVLYTMQGGLWAVLMTDVLQFIVLTTVVMMVAILMIVKIDDPVQFVSKLPDNFFSPTAGNYGWLFLMGWVIINFFIKGAEWAFIQRFISVRSPKDAKKSAYLIGAMYLVTPLFWLLPPLLYRGQMPNVNKEQAYILAAQSVLPPGVLGLMVAAMFSATASMVSSQLNVFAGVLTNDFYKAFFRPRESEKHYLNVGRVLTVCLGVLLMIMAICVPYMGGAEKLIISINSLLVVPLFAPTLWGLFSQKIGLRDMMVVALTSFSIGLFLKFGLAQNSMIHADSALFTTAQFLKEQSKNVDVIVGVVLPILMLCVYQIKKTSVDRGHLKLQNFCEENKRENAEAVISANFDPFPARMVMGSLSLLGGWMLILSFLSTQKKAVMVVFALILLLFAFVIHRFIKKKLEGNLKQGLDDLSRSTPSTSV